MELIGIVLLIIFGNLLSRASKNARRHENDRQANGRQAARRAGGHSPRPAASAPRQQLRDIVDQMMGQLGLEDADAPIETEFVGEGAPRRVLTPSYVPPSGYGEGDSRWDALGCVGGSMANDAHEGMEFPGHIHNNAAPSYEPTLFLEPEPARERARLSGRDARHALVMAEVLGRPVSMRRGGLRR